MYETCLLSTLHACACRTRMRVCMIRASLHTFCTCTAGHPHTLIRTYARALACSLTCTYARAHTFIRRDGQLRLELLAGVYMYLCVQVCMHVFVHACMHVSICIYMFAHAATRAAGRCLSMYILYIADISNT